MIERRNYTDMIKLYMDKPFIKIITGVHRSGKTTILRWVSRELKRRGVEEEQILYVDYEAFDYGPKGDLEILREQARIFSESKGKRLYLLLDEIQYLSGWETAILGLYKKCDCDIYLTGARAGLLYPQTTSLLAGNYVEIPIYPYSFSEFLEQMQESRPDESRSDTEWFQDFYWNGSMPGLYRLQAGREVTDRYLLDVCKSALLQDAVRLGGLRNVGQLWTLLGYLALHLGEPLSPKTISDGLNGDGCQVSKDTVYGMVRALENSQIICRIMRMDIREERIVETREKYYFADWGMCHALRGRAFPETAAVLENIVCLELLARGFRVYRGKLGRREFDFLVERGRKKYAIQVREHVKGPMELVEAAGPLVSLKGPYAKMILTMDPGQEWNEKYEIRRRYLVDFLMDIV